MRCESVHELFSELYDGARGSGGAREAALHLERCPACRTAYETFARTTDRLRAEPAPLPDAHVAAIRAALAGARPLPVARPWRGLASHLAAAAAGALVVLGWVVLGWRAERAPEPRAEPAQVARAATAPEPPGEVAPAVAEAPPRVVERVVEVPVPTRDAAVMRGIAIGLQRLCHAIERRRAMPEAPDPPAPTTPAGRVASPVVADATPATPTARRPEPLEGLEPPEPTAVRIRREGDRLSLRTRGPLARVVPNLIAQLESPDPDVVALVDRRLEAIRRDLARETDLPPAPARAAQPRSGGATLASLLFGEERQDEGAAPLERWSRWWEVNAAAVAGPDAGF